MVFNSFNFMVFFPIVVLVYFLIPQKMRYLWILISSYYFYMCWNAAYALILLGISIVTYAGAIFLDEDIVKAKRLPDWKRKAIVVLTIILCLFTLGIFKYADFFFTNAAKVFSILGIHLALPTCSFVLPVGISFYTFQALGYVIDVYRNDMRAEKNFFLYAAFISFFPQLVAGPIERAKNLLPQFSEVHTFNYHRVKQNVLLMLWGFFMKMVIADRIAIFVDTVYNDYINYNGWILIIAAVLFAFQIYCDFAGYSTIAIGAAGVMGFSLMENFRSPYCACGIRDFWSRWHISLTGWFRDYLYIPLGGNRRGKLRKYLNNLIVFLFSGLWHGARWSFVIWGGLNGALIVAEDALKSAFQKFYAHKDRKDNSILLKVLKCMATFVLVDFTWIFFRAPGTRDAINILKQMTHLENIKVLNVFNDNTIHFYIMERHCFLMMLFFLLLLIIVDIFHNCNVHFLAIICRQPIVVRWSLYLGLIMTILIFGVWGPSFDATAFIYFQF